MLNNTPFFREFALKKINIVQNIQDKEDVINVRKSIMFHLIYCAFLKNQVVYTKRVNVLIVIIPLSSMNLHRNVELMDAYKLFLKDVQNVDSLTRKV